MSGIAFSQKKMRQSQPLSRCAILGFLPQSHSISIFSNTYRSSKHLCLLFVCYNRDDDTVQHRVKVGHCLMLGFWLLKFNCFTLLNIFKLSALSSLHVMAYFFNCVPWKVSENTTNSPHFHTNTLFN